MHMQSLGYASFTFIIFFSINVLDMFNLFAKTFKLEVISLSQIESQFESQIDLTKHGKIIYLLFN